MPQIINPNKPRNEPALIAWHYKNFAVKSTRWKLIQYRDGVEELYDSKSDPLEQNNIIDKPEFGTIAAQLRAYIPAKPILPIGMTKWTGDSLDEIVGTLPSAE